VKLQSDFSVFIGCLRRLPWNSKLSTVGGFSPRISQRSMQASKSKQDKQCRNRETIPGESSNIRSIDWF